MAWALERTSWRGVRVDHPRDWEIALAAGPHAPLRCAFADRHFHRLDIRWREVQRPPNLRLLLEKHRQNPKGELRDMAPVSNLPTGWYGLLRKGEGGCVTYAAKVFRDRRMLAEATLFWPGQRDPRLEAAILESVATEASGPVRLWQAMGLSLDLGEEFKLRSSSSSVGRVRWEFATAGRETTTLTVERLAMPDCWLKVGLEDWLADQLPPRQIVVEQSPLSFNGHSARRLVSRGRPSVPQRIVRRRPRRLDVAWLCPTENRLYHLAVAQTSRREEVELPPSLVVRCCRPVPQATVEAGRTA